MKKTALIFILIIFILGFALEAFLRYSNWSETNIVQGWGELQKLKSGTAFYPNRSITLNRTDFKTNSSGERDVDHSPEKASTDIRIGVFGGLNVLGFGLPKKNTLVEFMKINPAPFCELQGRTCVYYTYGRTGITNSETIKLIQEKLKSDSLDVVVWIVDPFSDLELSMDLPWTSSLAVNWALAPLSWKKLKKGLSSPPEPSNVLSKTLPEVRQLFLTTKKDLIPVVIPAMDQDLSSQQHWELSTSSEFFNNGFLPLRAKSLIQEKTRVSLALWQTGLLGDEALRALASLIRERIQKSPQMQAHQ